MNPRKGKPFLLPNEFYSIVVPRYEGIPPVRDGSPPLSIDEVDRDDRDTSGSEDIYPHYVSGGGPGHHSEYTSI